MPEPSLFRHYQIVQDADGSNIELIRDANQVAVLAYDTQRQEFVHCHVLLHPLADKPAFEDACRALQKKGHPLLARLGDFGEDEGNPFYITGNVDGETLRSYLTRQPEIPGWLAVMVACRALETVLTLVECADAVAEDVLTSLRVVQTGAQQVQVLVADYRLLTSAKKAALKPALEKPARLLRTFFQEQSGGGPTLPDQAISGPDFMELLEACLTTADRGSVAAMRELKTALNKLVPEHLSGEIPTAHKPRALLAPHLATYQEVARGVVNLVRIQSQRLDMASPYSMRGILTKTGRTVLVEQIPPGRLVGTQIKSLDEKALEITKSRDFPGLIPVVMVHETDEITCLAEELPEGVSLADILRERHSLSVHETYLVLASLDGALDGLEKSKLELKKLRLEDAFILTGFPREDARTTKLLLTPLNEWPAFSLMLRAHPNLSAMAGRGLDPAVLLPPVSSTDSTKLWQSAWLAAVGSFLSGLTPLPGLTSTASGVREREALSRLFEDEISGKNASSTRADFLARYARLLQHHEAVKPPVAAPTPAPVQPKPAATTTEPKAKTPVPAPTPSRTRSISKDKDKDAQESANSSSPIMALTQGYTAPPEKPTIGFAEVLFRDTSVMEKGQDHDWAKTAADAPPTVHPKEVLLPPDQFVPFWLRAAVFLGGSMILGGLLAHLSGDAIWLKSGAAKPATHPKQPPASTSAPAFQVDAPTPRPSSPSTPAAPKKVLPPEPPSGPAAPQISVPTLPPETSNSASGGLLQPPKSSLKNDL